ncbi:hypothetical protein Hanom_Chr16g01433791 [Helianthus anomalus]
MVLVILILITLMSLSTLTNFQCRSSLILHQTSIINILIRKISSCNMFDERVYEIERLILIILWFYNMKQWRFKEFWGFEKLGFVVLVSISSSDLLLLWLI